MGNRMSVLIQTDGRPLGMQFDLDGNLIVADAIRGLIKVDMQGTLTICLLYTSPSPRDS